jgi:hypothetical protein
MAATDADFFSLTHQEISITHEDTMSEQTQIRATVKEKYGAAALRVAEGESAAASCCAPATGTSGCCGSTTASWDPITADLYDAGQASSIPAEALLASLGCGNPTALAQLEPGETVLDLGSGGGIDVLLSAKRVGPTGKAYGLDMTTRCSRSPRRPSAAPARRPSSSSAARSSRSRCPTSRWT